MTHVTCRLTAKNRDQRRNPTLGNRVWAAFTFFSTQDSAATAAATGERVVPWTDRRLCRVVRQCEKATSTGEGKRCQWRRWADPSSGRWRASGMRALHVCRATDDQLDTTTFSYHSLSTGRRQRRCADTTQPCIPPGSLNRVPASAGVRAGMSPLPGGR